eukprot:UN04053
MRCQLTSPSSTTTIPKSKTLKQKKYFFLTTPHPHICTYYPLAQYLLYTIPPSHFLFLFVPPNIFFLFAYLCILLFPSFLFLVEEKRDFILHHEYGFF